MSASPSPAAMKAQAEMFQLLSLHFDGETGRYAKGWSDGKIASTTGIAVEMVTAFRVAGRSEEHTSELQSLMRISYAVFCLNKKQTTTSSHMLATLLAN